MPSQKAGMLAPPTATNTPAGTPGGRSKLLWPFASTSPWNYPIGSGAQYVDANLPSTFFAVENSLVIMAPNAPSRPMRNNGEWWPGTTCNASGSTS